MTFGKRAASARLRRAALRCGARARAGDAHLGPVRVDAALERRDVASWA